MATQGTAIQFDPDKLGAFMQQVVGDMGAAVHATLVLIGDKLGLYRAMSGAGPLTPAELAAKTKTAERYIREWLNANAASGYVKYDAATKRYELPPEQAFALTVQGLDQARIAAVGVEPAADGRLLVAVEPDRVRDLRVSVTAPGGAVKAENTPITVLATDIANGEALSVGEHFFAPK